MSHHVLHVGGGGADLTPQLVVQLKDLLTVGPEDGSSSPVTRRIAAIAGVNFPLVAAQQLPELIGVWQEEGGRISETQEQHRGDEEAGHGSAGHRGTSAV